MKKLIIIAIAGLSLALAPELIAGSCGTACGGRHCAKDQGEKEQAEQAGEKPAAETEQSAEEDE